MNTLSTDPSELECAWSRDEMYIAEDRSGSADPIWVSPPNEGECNRSHRILVVDDNHDAADSLAELFGVMGAKVSVAYGAQEALILMMKAHPRMAFIDISMPLMNGYELAAKIRASDTFAGVVLIAMTGWGQAPETRGILNNGFDHHLTKPADVHKLTHLLQSIP